ncbi:MAG: glycosyltransferase [Sphingomonadaceae bacterium]|nr:glycosyltransferase [Sphingomonadaceae bacterium]
MHRFRKWDSRTPNLVDHFIANSHFIKRRIWKIYRREAEVIYPPVDVERFALSDAPREDYFLFASRLVPYKRARMVVEAFSQRPDLKLRVVGDGPEMGAVKAAAGSNVEILGHLPFEGLIKQMQGARAFVFAALEDFGIAPVEAQACGTPVIALGAGGTAETVRPLGEDMPTGIWFKEQRLDSLLAALDEFVAKEGVFAPADCRKNAESFSSDRFRSELGSYISDKTGA